MEFGPLRIRIIIEPDEGALIERLIEQTCALAGFDLASFRKEHEGEPIRTNRFELLVNRAEGLTGQLFVIEALVSSKKDTASAFGALIERLTAEDRVFLRDTVESRIDEESRCFVRLDKMLFLNDVFALVDHGKCVHCSFTIMTYPRSRDAAVRFVEEILDHE